jgi:xanthine dehydrogenase accessory factor
MLFNQKHDKVAARNQSGMICSGEQTILMYQVPAKDVPAVDALVTSLRANRNGCLQLFPTGIAFSHTVPAQNFYLALINEQDFIYEEKTGFKNELVIIGAGHIALALVQAYGRKWIFYIRLYDHRDHLQTMEQNSFVHEKHLVTDYAELDHLVTGGSFHFAVIMTVGYRTDAIALKAIMHKHWKYLGVLGSAHKVTKLRRG